MSRRIVRVTPTFFEHLDSQLPSHRGPDGEPSATDFVLIDLPPILDTFALNFEGLPRVEDHLDWYRMTIGAGRLVRAYAAFGC